MQSPRLLTPVEVAKLLGVTVQTLAVWRCERRYDLPYVKVGSYVRYRPADIELFIERGTQTPVGPLKAATP